MFFTLAFTSLAIEAVIGYPTWLYARIGHPVSWIGRLIAWCDTRWNRSQDAFAARRWWGIAALCLCLVIVLATSVALTLVLEGVATWPLNMLLVALLASSLIAQRSLYEHVAAVALALEDHGLAEGRQAVSVIVGRDPASLDVHAVSRAAIESLSENFSDGIVAPIFWLAVGGFPGAALYKTINTADSMIGHKSERHLAFGWAAARLDDLVNLPASRLSALWIAMAAFLIPGATGKGALMAVLHDASKHRSPNAGWPEAAMAGALGLKLAGPRVYGGKTIDDHWMGSGRAEADATDIRRALRVYRAACGIQAGVIALIALWINL